MTEAQEEKNFTKEEWMAIAWSSDPAEVPADTRKVLETYSKIPAAEIDQHVTDIRKRAFQVFPYPCIGRWRFLHMAIGQHPRYPEVLRRMLTGNEIFLDMGCAFAQDVRRLVADGVDSSKCYGTDLRLEFLDLGYELFRDKDSLKSTFIQGDLFAEESDLVKLNGKVDMIHASSFFHLFSYEQQKVVAHRCLKLWTGKPGNLVFGRQVGNEEPGAHISRAEKQSVFRHNSESWKTMWDEVSAESGVKFKVESTLLDRPDFAQIGKIYGREEGFKLLVYSVEVVQ